MDFFADVDADYFARTNGGPRGYEEGYDLYQEPVLSDDELDQLEQIFDYKYDIYDDEEEEAVSGDGRKELVVIGRLCPDQLELFKNDLRSRSLVSFVNQKESPLLSETRLPKDVVPVHYNFTITVFLPDYGTIIEESQKFAFAGILKVTVKKKVAVEEIVLNQKNLTVETDNKKEKPRKANRPNRNDSTRTTSAGRKMNDRPGGLFKTEYQSANNKTIFGAATRMEPIEARRMVPCFDEPEYKATWGMTIVHPKETHALTNQKEIKAHSIQCIESFEAYFQIPIPLPKMDMVAVKEFGDAMEN